MRRNSKRTWLFATLLVVCFAIVVVGVLMPAHAPAVNVNQSTDNGSSAADAMPSVQALMHVTHSNPNDAPIMTMYPGFMVAFDEDAHIPYHVAWELTADKTNGTLARKNEFTVDYNVAGCAQLNDYRNSGFARGHMAPSADMKWSKESMDACFNLTNICPQRHELNNGAWKSVEDKCRKWARQDSLLVIIAGPVMTDKMTQTIGASRVKVPERFFKVILAPYANPPRAIGFVMPNGYVEGGMQKTMMTIDDVEQITGYDFFAALPDSLENEIESTLNRALWR